MAPATSWSPARARIQLKLSVQRIRLLSTKKQQLAKVTRREISALLDKGKLESARIKVEGVMGEDAMVELLEILELYCELLLARFGLLETVRELDPGVAEAVTGIVFAAPRTELKELHILRELLMSKYGRDFAVSVMDNTDGIVSPRVTSKLAITQPPPELVDSYLHIIAQSYGIDWAPEGYVEPESPAATPVPTAPEIPATPTKLHPAALAPLPDTPPVDPSAAPRTVVLHTNLPSPGLAAPAAPKVVAKASAKDTEQDEFDALSKRFEALKKR